MSGGMSSDDGGPEQQQGGGNLGNRRMVLAKLQRSETGAEPMWLNLIHPAYWTSCSPTTVRTTSNYENQDLSGEGAPGGVPAEHIVPAFVKMRRATAAYRKGYLAWRMNKPAFAKGDPHAVLNSSPSEVARGGRSESGFSVRDGRRHEFMFAEEPLKVSESVPDFSHPSTILDAAAAAAGRQQPEAAATTATTLDRKRTEEGIIAAAAAAADGGGGGATTAAAAVSGSAETTEPSEWLRFYYNPMTPIDQFDAGSSIQLRRSGLAELAAVSTPATLPAYELPLSRDSVDYFVAHIGVGGFHRSHQAVYLDELLAEQAAEDAEKGLGGGGDRPLWQQRHRGGSATSTRSPSSSSSSRSSTCTPVPCCRGGGESWESESRTTTKR
eukprot:GHVU01195945.1.p1 GENE.GHVU01195945.1~~GHVU01195945.1.p1  ORF type:complete len:383 (-),score=83.10 GHVU01195945.1:362-1510(-)